MKRHERQWEAIMLRPALPKGWDTLEQRGSIRYSETSYVCWGKDHHLGESRRFWIVFCEFNPEYWANKDMPYRYTVRGGRDVKPSEDLRYFKSIKEATDYIIFLAESTNFYLKEVNSEETIQRYNKKIADIKKMSESR
jgi:hypothetical protein